MLLLYWIRFEGRMMEIMRLRATLMALTLGALALAVAPVQALPMTATNSTPALLDGTSTKLKVTLGGGLVTKVTVFVDLTKCSEPMSSPDPSDCTIPNPNPGNSYPEEIVLRLTNPGGIEISLVESFPNPTFDSNFDPDSIRLELTFDQSAAKMIGGAVLPSSGPFKPIESLDLLNGPTIAGDWELFVADTGGGDPLAFHSFTLNVTVDDQQTRIPEPGTMALLGLGLAGLGVLKRRRC